jgi:hypothetical protein
LFVVIGGQHISAAVRAVFDWYKDVRKFRLDKIPEGLTSVHAAVLEFDTPLAVCKFAAGEHQREQTDTLQVNTFDIVKHMVTVCTHQYRQGGTAFLNEDKIWEQLQSLGLNSIKEIGDKFDHIVGKEERETSVVCSLGSHVKSPSVSS